jgi:hypothetical protein
MLKYQKEIDEFKKQNSTADISILKEEITWLEIRLASKRNKLAELLKEPVL